MQFYWRNSPPTAPPLVTIPEQRVYISTERADSFVTSFLRFSKGEVISDDGEATVLVEPFESEGREAAMVQFPGGYIGRSIRFCRRRQSRSATRSQPPTSAFSPDS